MHITQVITGIINRINSLFILYLLLILSICSFSYLLINDNSIYYKKYSVVTVNIHDDYAKLCKDYDYFQITSKIVNKLSHKPQSFYSTLDVSNPKFATPKMIYIFTKKDYQPDIEEIQKVFEETFAEHFSLLSTKFLYFNCFKENKAIYDANITLIKKFNLPNEFYSANSELLKNLNYLKSIILNKKFNFDFKINFDENLTGKQINIAYKLILIIIFFILLTFAIIYKQFK